MTAPRVGQQSKSAMQPLSSNPKYKVQKEWAMEGSEKPTELERKTHKGRLGKKMRQDLNCVFFAVSQQMF